MRKSIYLICTACLALAACNKIDSPVSTDPDVMNIIPSFTETRVAGESFQEGDKIGVYITEYENNAPVSLLPGGNFKNNNLISYTGGKWIGNPTIYWGEGKYDIYGYYPYDREQENVPVISFRLAEDQSKLAQNGLPGGYEASDFLWGRTKGITRQASVPLIFSHVMSKLTINLKKSETYEGTIPETAEVILHNTVIDSKIDLSSGVVLKDRNSAPKSVKMKKLSNETYTAIVVPQRIEVRQPLIEIVCNNVSYMVNAMFIFKPHVHHTINVILNSNPEKVKIEIGGEIQGGWTE